MQWILWIFLIVGTVSWIKRILPIVQGIKKIPCINFPGVNSDTHGLLSVVIAACNEEEEIENSIRSLLTQDYPRLEVIAIDDRSEDQTGTILDRLAVGFPNILIVKHIHELPHGWLGKNHALAMGAEIAHGEWILFSDADVFFKQGVLSRAMQYVLAEKLDHLTLIPYLVSKGFWEGAMNACFTFFMLQWIRFWKVADSRCEDAMGIGAFNLVSRQAYEKLGGYEAIRLCVDDDVKLAECLKDAGMHIGIAGANQLLSVRWQKGMWGIIKGMEKNAFAAFLFRCDIVCAIILWLMIVHILPYIYLIFWHNIVAQSICAAQIALAIVTYWHIGRFFATPMSAGLVHPFLILFIIYAIANSTLITLKNGGIRWRTTFYGIEELRNFKPPLKRKFIPF